jgi:hypothetical protein
MPKTVTEMLVTITPAKRLEELSLTGKSLA